MNYAINFNIVYDFKKYFSYSKYNIYFLFNFTIISFYRITDLCSIVSNRNKLSLRLGEINVCCFKDKNAIT